MNKFRISLTSLALLFALAAAPVLTLRADSCDTDSCSTSNQTSCNSCGDSSCNGCDNACSTCHSIIATRPTHDNTAYRYLPFAHQDLCSFNGGITLGYMFNQTFDPCGIAQCAFGATNGQLIFQGSAVTNRSANALVADYFGLSPLFQGTLRLSPQVRNHSLKFESYWDFAGFAEGLYLRADLTFSHQERSLFGNGCNTCSTDSTISNTSAFPVGYMAATAVNAAPDILTALQGAAFGDMTTPWKYGKFSTCKLSTNKIDGFSVDLGYDFIRSDDSHFGIFIRYAAPTGTKIDESYNAFVFAPLVGNMHHHELGGGLNAHKELWSNDCGDSFTVDLDGYATHLFNDSQVRSFDFGITNSAGTNVSSSSCNTNSCDDDNDCGTGSTSVGCLSRYMLLKQMSALTSAQLAVTATNVYPNAASGYTFTGTLIPGINFATRRVCSSIGVKGEATLRFVYRHNNFSMQFGYNIFGRQEEKLCFQTSSIPCQGTSNQAYDSSYNYGFKGCNGDYYYFYTTTVPTAGTTNFTINQAPPGTAVASNATSSSATGTSCGTINSGLLAVNFSVSGTPTGPGVGVNYTQAYNTLLAVQANAVPNTTVSANLSLASNSAPAVVLSNDPNLSLNLESGRAARLVTSKGFVTLDYTWECSDWQPYLSLGGEAEGGSNCCDFKQWGVWLKGGFSF